MGTGESVTLMMALVGTAGATGERSEDISVMASCRYRDCACVAHSLRDQFLSSIESGPVAASDARGVVLSSSSSQTRRYTGSEVSVSFPPASLDRKNSGAQEKKKCARSKMPQRQGIGEDR